MSMQIEPPMDIAAQDASHHHSAEDARRDHAYLDAAKDRGWITLDEIMKLASGSPVDTDEALHVTREDFFAYVVLEGAVTLAPVPTRPDEPTVDELVLHYRAAVGEHEDWDAFRTAMVAERRSVVRLAPERGYGMLDLPARSGS